MDTVVLLAVERPWHYWLWVPRVSIEEAGSQLAKAA